MLKSRVTPTPLRCSAQIRYNSLPVPAIVKPLTSSLSVAAAGTWSLEAAAWSALLGFPGVVCLHQQRLWFAGSNGFPDRIWGSVVADYENFGRGVADDDSVEYQLAMSGVNLIRWMKALPEGLAIGTMAGEVTLDGGGSEAALTPRSGRSTVPTSPVTPSGPRTSCCSSSAAPGASASSRSTRRASAESTWRRT